MEKSLLKWNHLAVHLKHSIINQLNFNLHKRKERNDSRKAKHRKKDFCSRHPVCSPWLWQLEQSNRPPLESGLNTQLRLQEKRQVLHCLESLPSSPVNKREISLLRVTDQQGRDELSRLGSPR